MRICVSIFFQIISICLALDSNEQSGQNKNDKSKWPYNLKYEFPYNTPLPINFNTNEIKFVQFDSPLSHYDPATEEALVKNTGNSIEVHTLREISTAYLTGGVYSTGIYRFKQARFYWTENINERSASSVNGKGWPVEAILFYYNEDYKTFDVAKTKRDGLAIVSLQIIVESGIPPNPKFANFTKVLEKIETAGSSEQTTIGVVFSWFTPAPTTQTYFAYPGSYIEDDGKENDSGVVLCIPLDDTLYLAEEDFQIFSKLKNSKGEQLVNQLPLRERGDRPVIWSNGLEGHVI